ncbi:MAG TPA: hypothetical protein VMY35_17835 [Phycisphaerae bacterium]|nr:hypothetical protein [Phycisphaerae bacterium]
MSRLGLMDRVKSWFGAPKRRDAAGKHSAAWSPAPAARLLLAGAAAKASASPTQTCCAFDGREPTSGGCGQAAKAPAVAATSAPPADDPEREARQTEWMHVLDSLPERIAESLAASAAGAKALEKIGRELEGHRDATRSLAQSVGRLPGLATDQTALAKQTCEILSRQTHLAEATVDGLAAMRAALGSVEESARRHVLAIGELERSHREVLQTYQHLVLATHRRLGRLAALAVVLASGALGAVAYVLWLALAQ